MIKACVFDVGNTLINDTKMVLDVLADLGSWLKNNGALTDEGAFTETYREFNRTIHLPHWSHTYGEVEWFDKTLKALKVNRVTPEEVIGRYRELLEEKTKPDMNVIDTFRFLKEMDMKVGLLSNERSARIAMFLRRTGLGRLAHAVIVSEEVGAEKPHPRVFEEMRRRLGVSFSEMAVFGDSEISDGGGQRLGTKFILVKAYKDPSWDWAKGFPANPDYIVEKVTRTEIERCLAYLDRAGT